MKIADMTRRARRLGTAFPRRRALAPASLFAAIGLGASSAQADETAPLKGYALAVAAQADSADSRSGEVALDLPLGTRGWTALRYSRLHSEADAQAADAAEPEAGSGAGSGAEPGAAPAAGPAQTTVDTSGFGVDAGVSLGAIELAAGYARRQDGALIEQQDLSASLSYRWPRATLGLDLFQRSAQSETMTSVERRRGDPLSVRIVEDFDGSGIGLHGSADLSDRLRIFASGMRYDYDSGSNIPEFLLRTRLSGVTQDQAFLQDSLAASLSYQFKAWTLTTDYSRDRVLDTAERLQTLSARLDLALGAHWLISAFGGYTDSDQWPGVGFGGTQISLRW